MPPNETFNTIIDAIEKIEINLLSKGSLDTAIDELNELDKNHPGQYLIKVSLAEAYVFRGDSAQARKFLFVASNFNPSDFRYEYLRWLVEAFLTPTPSGKSEMIRRIEKGGSASFQYLVGFSHYLAMYKRRYEQHILLRLIAESNQSLARTQSLIETCMNAQVPDEFIEPMRTKLRKT
jgi:hypothetical protein